MNVKTHISIMHITVGTSVYGYPQSTGTGGYCNCNHRELCRKTEEELSSIPFIKGKNLQAIKDMLAEKVCIPA